MSIYREGITGSLGCNSYNLSILKVFSNERIHQSVTNVSSAMFNTQFQALNNDVNISTYWNFLLDLIIQNNVPTKDLDN